MLSRFSRLSIPKSEDDVRRISEEIMQQEQKEVVAGAEERGRYAYEGVDLSAIVHELTHIQELLLHIIQAIRELRDSVDTLSITIKKTLRALALLQMVNHVSDLEAKHKLLEHVYKDLGVELKK
jgi:DNA polymerase III gamma/tau subunit